jgi:hypothetical protein
MSTDDLTPAHPNDPPDLTEDANTSVGDHTQPNGGAIMTAASANRVSTHDASHVFDEVTTSNASVTPSVQATPQTVPLDDQTEPGLSEKETANTVEGEPNGQSQETKGQDDGDGEDEDDEGREVEEEYEEDEEDDDDEPALKYERFSGAFQDLLKKDSASALAVSNKFLVEGVVATQCLLLTHYAGARFAQWLRTYPRLDRPADQDI